MTKSQFADRETVGATAVKAAQSGDRVEVGDMGREMVKSFLEDLNEALESNPFDDRPFYVIIHEKKDMQLTNAIIRRVYKQMKRPYPEPATSVFWTDPARSHTKFCWALPHQSVWPNVVSNPERYNHEMLEDIKAYTRENMEHFGFVKGGVTDDKIPLWVENVAFLDRELV